MGESTKVAKDLFHESVKTALIKEGWTITKDPLTIRIDRVKLEIDLAAEKVFAAERDGQKIAIEVKGFIQPSVISDFHTALGQFLNYRLALEMTDPDRILYLAVPEDISNNFFQERFVQAAIKSYVLKLLVYNPSKEEIILWQY
ncbi:MAG: XisH family protein [Synechococcales cyanobacterium K44_A2020_017]|nr:XisH family protein [Synechococcales cyanobacterium K32_A2020_035]MBF2095176.1 XisH family protein [Synechococcales cyanobacterium K44_A2020_017]